MAERKYTHGLTLEVADSTAVISIGEMEIWDGADLSLIRDTILKLADDQDVTSICIDMSHVQHVPSGFFGMLFDWHERGVRIRLLSPRERVQLMLWFRKFFRDQGQGIYSLHDGEGIDEEFSEDLWHSTKRREQTPLKAVPSSPFPM